ncbi:MAG: hypothetical protein WA081_18545 [Desulfosalsimonadaceae bacterium]
MAIFEPQDFLRIIHDPQSPPDDITGGSKPDPKWPGQPIIPGPHAGKRNPATARLSPGGVNATAFVGALGQGIAPKRLL